ncbi:hypothetical protein [Asticcacaulis sp. AND118]|uniref:hypothetical protein n=1 Tax=Asticcacaulis sp. AND118 TaxID=2840468 RepID=UPI001D001544|nr:hypothetical protein [Asticcacaulis sp. AND118]UDF03241.1 hypothetical protein LH365_12465 [Asticcacaulis sp. AND118]
MPLHSRTCLSALGLALFGLTVYAPVSALAQARPYLDWPGKSVAQQAPEQPQTAPATPLERALPNAATGQPGFDIPASPYGQVGNPYTHDLNWRGKASPAAPQAAAPAPQAQPHPELASNWTPQPQSCFDAPRAYKAPAQTKAQPQTSVPAPQPQPEAPPQPVPAKPQPQPQATLRSYAPPVRQAQPASPPPVPAQAQAYARPAPQTPPPATPNPGWIPTVKERVQSPPQPNPAYGWIPSPSERLQEARPASQPPKMLPQARVATPAPLPTPKPPIVSAETMERETAAQTAVTQPKTQSQPKSPAPVQAQVQPQPAPQTPVQPQALPDSGYRLPPNSKYAGRVSPELEARAATPAQPVQTDKSVPKAATTPAEVKAAETRQASAPTAAAPLAQAAEQESAEPYTPFVPGSRATNASQTPRFYSLHRAYGYEPDPAPHSGGDLALDPNAVQTPTQDDKNKKTAPQKETAKTTDKTKSDPKSDKDKTL